MGHRKLSTTNDRKIAQRQAYQTPEAGAKLDLLNIKFARQYRT